VKLKVAGESPVDPNNGDQADLLIAASMTDVRSKADLSDYDGELEGLLTLRITDRLNGTPTDQPGTVTDLSLPFPMTCATTPDDQATGSSCNTSTSADTLIPGAAREGKRAVWGLGQIEVFDGGPDGLAATEDNSLFAVQGIYAP
jgi:hypothetical protein